MVSEMANCDICGKEIEDDYYIEEYFEEVNGKDAYYCRTCREYKVSQVKKKYEPMKKTKVRITKSDYPLPGFVMSKDRTHFVKGKGK